MKRTLASMAALSAVALAGAPPAHADQVAYLVNVHVRPGYNFPNAEAALGYGYSIFATVSKPR
jgi:hypothetical protein